MWYFPHPYSNVDLIGPIDFVSILDSVTKGKILLFGVSFSVSRAVCDWVHILDNIDCMRAGS